MATQINQSALENFRSGFAGEIILPEHPGYDEARKIFNAMINKRPGIIAQCAKVEDVTRAVSFGREFNLEIAVRGGGHSVSGKGYEPNNIFHLNHNIMPADFDPV